MPNVRTWGAANCLTRHTSQIGSYFPEVIGNIGAEYFINSPRYRGSYMSEERVSAVRGERLQNPMLVIDVFGITT
jgi:hypothetical protein